MGPSQSGLGPSCHAASDSPAVVAISSAFVGHLEVVALSR